MSRGYPSMTALLGLLAIAGYQNRDKLAELFSGSKSQDHAQNPAPASGQGDLGGLIGNLGGALAGGSAGSFLNSGLGELLDRFQQGGHGEAAQSWVKQGPNQELAPHQLEQAIGPETLDALTRQTGLSREELLARLSRNLPGAVDQYTPDGRVPA